MNIDRRGFLRRAGRAAIAAGTLGCLEGTEGEAKDDPVLPLVDTHQHLWDLSKFRLPWLPAAGPLSRSFVTKDYLEATRGLNVVKAVYMEVAVQENQQVAEAEYVIDLCRRQDNLTCAAVIGGRPASDDFRRYITRFRDGPYVKGVRQILQDPRQCVDERLVRGVRLLGELGMSFDLCIPPTALLAGAKLIDRCCDTRFILDHCGNADPKAFRGAQRGGEKPQHRADQWRRDIAGLATRKNVVCKISGIVARASKGGWTPGDLAPIINHCVEVFGPDRVMFGGDWPVCTPVATFREWVTALKQVIGTRDTMQQRKLLHDNAVRFYGLT